MVAQMLKNPDAMKMVLNYLTKQNLNDHQKKWRQMSNSKKKGNQKRKKNNIKKKPTTVRPVITTTSTTTKRSNGSPSTKSPIIQITQINRRNDNVGHPDVKEKQVKCDSSLIILKIVISTYQCLYIYIYIYLYIHLQIRKRREDQEGACLT